MYVGKKNLQYVHILVMFTTVFAMMTVCFFVLMFSARSIIMSKQLLQQKVKVRAMEDLETAGQTMAGILNEIAIECSGDAYASILTEVIPSAEETMSEEETRSIFRETYIDYMKERCLLDALNSRFNDRFENTRGVVALSDTSNLVITPEYGRDGNVSGLILSGITLNYTYGEVHSSSRDFTYEIELPTATFYNSNETLFGFSLVGEKGVYFTGKTSSVVGNLYAGTHPSEEFRKAEGSYGEREIYGGLNVLSTQLGIDGQVVSAGNINLKGAFVVFGTNEHSSDVYVNQINELSGYFTSTDYVLNGEVHSQSGTEYDALISGVEIGGEEIDHFAYYYDSNNDENYHGKYRLILSNSDVNLSGDFTGVVLTCGNVIIEADANVEGLVYSKDRIYVQGNNNIVSNWDILREIIDDECEKTPGYGSFYLKDYLGGIQYKTGVQHSAGMVKMF